MGKLLDRYPLKKIYLPILFMQVPLLLLASQSYGWMLYVAAVGYMLFVFGAIPFTDSMIVKYIDDRMRSRVTGMRLAVGLGLSSLVVATLGPSVKAAGFTIGFDTAADSVNQTPILLYTNGENDLTDDLLQQLNANAPATPSVTGNK